MAEIIRMWIIHVRQRGEIDLDDIIAVPIRKEAQIPVIAVSERLDDLLVVSLLGRGNTGRGSRKDLRSHGRGADRNLEE